ncbi:MAG: phage tail tube protein [Actinomycetota bacterium]|nr:phage tail tube protein [Actinomycetota bacterium]
MAGPRPQDLTVLGIAREVTKGTPVAPADFIPVTSLQGWRNIHVHNDTGWRGSMAEPYDSILGPYSTEVDFAGNVHSDLIGYLLKAILGEESVVGSSPAAGTALAAGSAIGAASISVSNNTGMTAAANVQVGTGTAAEVVTIATVTGAGPYTVTFVAGQTLQRAHLAAEAVVPVSSAFVHTIAEYNAVDGQPQPYTLTDSYAIAARAYPYCLCSDLTLNYGADALLTYTAKLMGRGEAPVAIPVPTFTTERAMAAWTTTATLFGGAAVVLSGSLVFRQAVTPVFALGAQEAYMIWGGNSGVTGKLSLLMLDDSMITALEAGTQGALVLNSATGAGAAQRQMQHSMSKVMLTNARVMRKAEAIGIDVDFTAMANLTDIGASGGYGLVRSQLTNGRPGSY